MFVVTLGIYQVYWAYKNWQAIKVRDGSDIMPFWRAIFLIFFLYPLLEQIKNTANTNGVSTNYSSLLITIIWIVLRIAFRVASEVLPLAVYISFAGLMYALILIPVQTKVNQLNATLNPEKNLNDRFSVWNIIAIACWSLGFVGAIAELVTPIPSQGFN